MNHILKADLFLSVFQDEILKRPPVWIMQSPFNSSDNYFKLNTKVRGFKGIVKTPELAAQETLYSHDKIRGDAVQLYSLMLDISEAMGLEYEVDEAGYPYIIRPITREKEIEQLVIGPEVLEPLAHVYETIAKVKKRIESGVSLIGIIGGPWTLMAYMLGGNLSKGFTEARRLLYTEPLLAHKLLTKITDATILHMQEMQRQGCTVLQVTDNIIGTLNMDLYEKFCFPYLKRITLEVDGPLIYFPRGGAYAMSHMDRLGFDAISVDFTQDLVQVRKIVGEETIIQGNLDPYLLYADPLKIRAEVKALYKNSSGKHIFNLGGVLKTDTPIEGIRAFIQAVVSLG